MYIIKHLGSERKYNLFPGQANAVGVSECSKTTSLWVLQTLILASYTALAYEKQSIFE